MVFCHEWDDHTGRLATLPMMLPPTTLLGRDLPRRERNILTNFAHSDDASSKHKGRQLRSGSQDEGSANAQEPKPLAKSTTGGQGGTQEQPQVQQRALAENEHPRLIRQRTQRPLFVLYPSVTPLLCLRPSP